MNWKIFQHKGFLALCAANAFISFTTSIIVIHLSAYAQLYAQFSSAQAAMLLSIFGVMGG